ncbi:MAG: response regulator [Anaerolineales bacterium]|nr:response regulator [Anaerolineales bacterium]
MKKILLIEDVNDTVELVRKILSARGYEFLHAPDAETGLQLALKHVPDLILLDLGLPDYDGQTLAGWIQNEKELVSIPLIAFTAWPEETARDMVNSYGFNGYISKPIVNVNAFAERVASFIK